jgi:hypothetical protein
MTNNNCICITAMARHRCRYYCEGPEECDRPPDQEPPTPPAKTEDLFSHIKNNKNASKQRNDPANGSRSAF